MTLYAADAADALTDLTEAGAAVTFAKVTPGVYDPTTDTWTDAVDASVSGFATQLAADLAVYQALGLVLGQTESLLFAPTVPGATPVLGATVTWAGISYTVRSVSTMSPDGFTVLATVIVSR